MQGFEDAVDLGVGLAGAQLSEPEEKGCQDAQQDVRGDALLELMMIGPQAHHTLELAEEPLGLLEILIAAGEL